MTTYQRDTIHTTDDIRAIADHAGSHFFDVDTLRFFNSRILDGVRALDGNATEPGRRYLFVTSERDNYSNRPRQYTVRIATLGTQRDNRPTIDIETIDDGYSLPTAAAARRFMQDYNA